VYQVTQDDLATIIYTSGTTGKPKGVELIHQNLVSVIVGTRNLNKDHLSNNYTSLAYLPWAHVYGLSTELNSFISAGCAMGLVPSREQILECIGLIKPDVIVSVPILFNKVYDGVMKNVRSLPALKKSLFHFALKNSRERNHALEFGKPVPFFVDFLHKVFDKMVFKPIRDKMGGNLKYMGSGGAAASMEVLQFFEDIGIPVCEGYGLTETSPVMSANSVSWENKRLGTVGPPLPGMDVRCVNPETLETVSPGEVGEVVVSGPNVMRGYHNKPEATAEVIFFKDGKRFFRTGDMGRFVDNKFLQITGRIKEQFKLENGKYVVPAPLEDTYARGPFIAQAFLYGANRPHNVLLVVPNYAELIHWAKANKKDALLALIPDPLKAATLSDNHTSALFAHDDFVHAINKEIIRNGRGVKTYEQPLMWHPLAQPFSQENQMQTPKMSLRRPIILKAYEDKIEAMYKNTAGHRIEYPKK
jgi:long-chain acyl-CoA synthetase